VEVAEQLGPTGVRIVAVNFDTPERVARYASAFGRDVLFLCDPGRSLYARLGIGRTSRARVWLHPLVWLAYVRLLIAGNRFRGPTSDIQQLGADVIFDPALRPTWIYRSRGPEDRPSIDEIRRRLGPR
jgi:hypothetical protein